MTTDSSRNLLKDGVATTGDRTEPAIWVSRLERILDRQCGIYQQLESLSTPQSQAIERDDAEALLSVLGQRQTLIDQLVSLNKDLAPFVESWDQLSEQLPSNVRGRLRDRFEEVSRRVTEIQTRNQADHQFLERKRQSVSEELSSMTNARGALAAYGQSAAPVVHPRYQDREV